MLQKNGKPKVIVDVCNVSRLRHLKNRLRRILKVKKFFSEKGIESILVASSALKYKILEQEKYKDLVKNNVILETPAGYDGDLFILEIANEFGAFILSNDRFSEYTCSYPFVDKRRIPFMFVHDRFIIPAIFLRSLLQSYSSFTDKNTKIGSGGSNS